MKTKNIIIALAIGLSFNYAYCAEEKEQHSLHDENQNFQKGIAAFNKGDLKSARKFLEPLKGSNILKLKIEANYYLAQINFKEKFYDLANTYITKALKLNITPIQRRQFKQLSDEINKFLTVKSYETKEIENLSRLHNKVPYRNLKIRMQGDNLNDSYEGLILRYNTELKDKNFNLAHTLLNTIAEIAYTSEGYANKDSKIAEYLATKGFTLDEIKKKLGQFKHDRDRSLIYISEK